VRGAAGILTLAERELALRFPHDRRGSGEALFLFVASSGERLKQIRAEADALCVVSSARPSCLVGALCGEVTCDAAVQRISDQSMLRT
jgi:hypothetical protein